MSKTIQLECFVCADQHGNYQMIGSSKKDQEHTMKAIVREGIANDEVNYTLQTFKVNFQLPEPKPEEVKDEDKK